MYIINKMSMENIMWQFWMVDNVLYTMLLEFLYGRVIGVGWTGSC